MQPGVFLKFARENFTLSIYLGIKLIENDTIAWSFAGKDTIINRLLCLEIYGRNRVKEHFIFPIRNINKNTFTSRYLFIFVVIGSGKVPPSKRSTGRPRGRPRGSGVGRRPRGRGSVRKAIAAAELAGAEAGKSAAYARYGYSYAGKYDRCKTKLSPYLFLTLL